MVNHTVGIFLKTNKEKIMTVAILFLTALVLFSILGINFNEYAMSPPELKKVITVETFSNKHEKIKEFLQKRKKGNMRKNKFNYREKQKDSLLCSPEAETKCNLITTKKKCLDYGDNVCGWMTQTSSQFGNNKDSGPRCVAHNHPRFVSGREICQPCSYGMGGKTTLLRNMKTYDSNSCSYSKPEE
tara:strand:+ start:823 stop:1380 length:558 start_codon:yes stop_codon:yes gene_type:complete